MAGLRFSIGQNPGEALANISDGFARSQEAIGRYPFLGEPEADAGEVEGFLETVYQNLFDREAEQGGLDF